MKKLLLILLIFSKSFGQNNPIKLLEENPHYFEYKNEPIALITSAEHYGALLNLDFDYPKYLRSLAAEGMNYTRIFTGNYFEISGQSFEIQMNSLAPKLDRVITPWVRLENGKFDLSKFNPGYFHRLHDFLSLADELDIIVEITLFCSTYNENHWAINPQNAKNNVNIKADIDYHFAHTLGNGELLAYQKSFVQKMVEELNDFDNFFYEIQNEPWADRAIPAYNIVNKEELRVGDWTYKADYGDKKALEWQSEMASIIVSAESNLPKKHLIAQNYTNYKAPIDEVEDNISIINFHYAWPEAVEWNYHFDKVIGFDESGFSGSDDLTYRRQAWQFMLSGGGLFNNLDYSFFVGQEDGLGYNDAPGGGGVTLRRQLKTLKDFLDEFDLRKLKPAPYIVEKSPGLIPYLMSDGEGNMAVYLRAVVTKKSTLSLQTGKGHYKIKVLNTISGQSTKTTLKASEDGILDLEIAIQDGELALKIEKMN